MKLQRIEFARQSGTVIALMAVAMVAMLGVMGLALDGGHSTLSLSRLQNVLDASALGAAKTLDDTGDTVLADVEARAVFASNAAASGNAEINQAYNAGDLVVSVEFSNTLQPFSPGSSPEQYVRVSADGFELQSWFAQVLGINDIDVESTSVAGPSPALTQICNVAPVMVCGDTAAQAAGDPFFGYEESRPYVLKASNPNDCGTPGNGNFQLIRLDGASGGSDIRAGLAGSYSACLSLDNQIETEPGNTVGPALQGLNTRFGDYQGGGLSQSDFPPDVVVTEANPYLEFVPDPNDTNPDASCRRDVVTYQGQAITTAQEAAAAGYYSHAGYRADLAAQNYDYQPLNEGGVGAFGRRTLAVPVGDCSAAGSGQTNMPLMGTLCFHVLQRATVQGNGNGNGGGGNGGGGNGGGGNGGGSGGNEARIFGEFLGTGCGVTGNPGSTPGNGPGPYVIQLYKDPDSGKS